MFKEIRKWNKGSGDLRVRSHPPKLPICGKELKKSEGNHQKQKVGEDVIK